MPLLPTDCPNRPEAHEWRTDYNKHHKRVALSEAQVAGQLRR